ncbi:hypothetical protein OCUAc20_46780 (plasmid) [Acinetobacter baumannii]|nr:hypothetical protein OCUAc20_46780 [Acinetobacter baumannii]
MYGDEIYLCNKADLKRDDITFSINPDIKYSYEYALGITKRMIILVAFGTFIIKP